MIKISEKLNCLFQSYKVTSSLKYSTTSSIAVFLTKFAPLVGSGHQNSMTDAVTFVSYARYARLERDLVSWLAKEVFDKLDTAIKRNGTPDHNTWLKAGVMCNRGESRIGTLPYVSPDTFSMIFRHSWKWDASLNTMLPQSV
ncbi:hypothetical protein TNCV_671491 [Trichonephila clavipes]|nr:hypothetical protein TNCV_671491 [Trichonephila clavipes]